MSQSGEILEEFADRLFSKMLEEIMTDLALTAHQEIQRSRKACAVCSTHCRQIHLPLSARAVGQSRAASPIPSEVVRSGSSISLSGAVTPTSSKPDGNLYFDCLNCGRLFASTRYAPHLSNCLGIGTSRRNTSRSSTTKPKSTPELRRSVTPSDRGANQSSEDSIPSKLHRNEKSTFKDGIEDDFSVATTVVLSEDASVSFDTKKRKHESVRSNASPYHSKIPSKLRETAVNSSPDGSPQSSRVSSPSHPRPQPPDFILATDNLGPASKRTKLSNEAPKNASGVQVKTLPVSRVNNSSVDYIFDGDEASADSSSSDES